ncbi:YjjG family noncanonical pyrimidine nucleotidase [Clostridium thermopalmarium]|uniref:Pyrimidine 5'-nucleotidase YjjG n=1 Tax=Clostridium thermopalmarium DSM 5974 TaxID=1121340 RepID=A0A2T0APC1_9CLOT|nr:YjjG family noncanonical pyrimidine nucleotidase [Clostridium thermopalmarium]PRR70867.1 Pyrimidine 5'-nucleotidase YjjG [Clostridium thermopalmarium DSM 5974]PVZ28791.1 putative hydrolase of the HAD superfamily [Clostridium thermopalmarium DSM 5974]
MKKYELIIFDADETLLDFESAEKYAFEKAMEELGINYDKEYHLKEYRKFNRQVWHELEEGLISPNELKLERFNRLFKKLDLKLDPKEANEKYTNALCEASFLLDGAEEILQALSGKYKLALITNGLLKVQNARIRQSNIAKYFHVIVISEEAGVAKPNPGIFKYTLEKIGHKNKDTVLMVGDSLNSDIKGGANFGIDTCWFNPKGLNGKSGLHPTYEIKTLGELKKILQ